MPENALPGHALLELDRLTAGYGKGDVLQEVSLAVPAGGIVGLIGANGAGKTTLALAVSGLTRIAGGDIRFDGRSIRRTGSRDIVELGIVQVPQGRLLFHELTVEENLKIGAAPRRARGHCARNLRKVEEHFPILRERRGQRAGLLSGGEQQMLAIGRALMGMPRLLILDEPSLGLAPRIIAQIFRTIRHIHAEGVTVLVSEQTIQHVLGVADYAYVLEQGRIRCSGTGAALRDEDAVRQAYFGRAARDRPATHSDSAHSDSAHSRPTHPWPTHP